MNKYDSSLIEGMAKGHPLDNVAWNSLVSRHRHLGITGEKAALYIPQVSMIAGVAENTAEAFAELARMAEPGKPVAIIGDEAPVDHPDWAVMQSGEGFQMTCGTPIEYEEREIKALTPSSPTTTPTGGCIRWPSPRRRGSPSGRS